MKKKLLFLASRIPYPLIGGDRIKNYHLIKILSKYFDLNLVIISNEELSKDGEDFLKEHTKSFKIFKKNKFQFLFALAKSLFNKKPLQVNYYYFGDVQRYIDALEKENDVLFSTLVRTTEYIRKSDKIKIFDMADSIGLNYKASYKNVKSLIWKFIYLVEYKRLLSYEKLCIDSFDKTFMFNKNELEYFNSKKTVFLPYSANNDEILSYIKTDRKFSNHVCFFGKMDYRPNIDAVVWFIENIIDRLDENIVFSVIGAKPVPLLKNLEKKYENLIITGFVEDPYEILKSSLCVVAPMQTGGGIQGKILETMALGTVNIVSSLAASPIGAEDGEEYIVEDDSVKMINLINNIYKQPELFEKYKINSVEFIKQNFTWKIYEEKLMKEMEEVIDV